MSKQILVVDDSSAICNLVARALESFDYNVVAANNGCEALKMLETTAFDLILLDDQMPIMTGRQFLKEYKWATAIIPISADPTFSAHPLLAKEALVKPFNVSQLLTAIEKVLRINEACIGQLGR